MFQDYYKEIDRLVKLAQDGDTYAVADLLSFYQPLIKKSIRRCLLIQPLLTPYKEDLESDVFLILNNLIKSYNPQLSFFSLYLSSYLDYAIMNQGKKYVNPSIELIPLEDIISDDITFEKAQESMFMISAIDLLKPSHQEVIRMYFYDDISQEDAAKMLNITQSAFCKKLKRALFQLKIILLSQEK